MERKYWKLREYCPEYYKWRCPVCQEFKFTTTINIDNCKCKACGTFLYNPNEEIDYAK